MTTFVMVIHGIIAVLLIAVILMQSGRGGGLTEGFASAESMFGAQTNEFMIKATTVFATLFFVTCVGLAVLSARKGKSLMSGNTAAEMREELPSALRETQQDMTKAAQEAAGEAALPMADTAAEQKENLQVTNEAPAAPVPEVPLNTLPGDKPASEVPGNK